MSDPCIKNYDPTRMQIIEQFYIPQLDRTRTIRIYLPHDYHHTSTAYPVIYMQDGQNVFEPSLCISGMSWQAGEHLDQRQHTSHFAGAILVAVDNSPLHEGLGRRNEYSPWPYAPTNTLAGWLDQGLNMGGEGGQYADFIAITLKPYIDAHYRTLADREHTCIAGSSMGGLISLYTALRHQGSFGKVGVFSPAFWFALTPLQAFISATPITLPIAIYMDIGTNETSNHDLKHFPEVYLDSAQTIASQLQSHSSHLDCQLHIDRGGIHSESAWAARFPAMMQQLFPSHP